MPRRNFGVEKKEKSMRGMERGCVAPDRLPRYPRGHARLSCDSALAYHKLNEQLSRDARYNARDNLELSYASEHLDGG